MSILDSPGDAMPRSWGAVPACIRASIAVLSFVAILATGPAVLAADPPLSGRLVAETFGALPGAREVQVIGPGRDEKAILVRGVFADVLAEYGYIPDIAAPVTAELNWTRFSSPAERPTWLTLQGTAGSRSAPDVSLTIELPPRGKGAGPAAPTYVLECRLLTSDGTRWRAEAEATSRSTDVKGILRVLARQLVHHFGMAVAERAFVGSPAR